VPLDAYPRLEQGGVILSWAQDRQAAEEFRSFLLGNEGRSILKRYGFILPGE
jgi:molybdate transport system substrate-binding protein